MKTEKKVPDKEEMKLCLKQWNKELAAKVCRKGDKDCDQCECPRCMDYSELTAVLKEASEEADWGEIMTVRELREVICGLSERFLDNVVRGNIEGSGLHGLRRVTWTGQAMVLEEH